MDLSSIRGPNDSNEILVSQDITFSNPPIRKLTVLGIRRGWVSDFKCQM